MKEISSEVTIVEERGLFTGFCTVVTEHYFTKDINAVNRLMVSTISTFNFVDPDGYFIIPSHITVEINKADFIKDADYFINLAKDLDNRIRELCISQIGSNIDNLNLRPLYVPALRDAAFSLRYE